MTRAWTVLIMLVLATIQDQIRVTEAQAAVGVAYGRLGNDLPPPAQVVDLYKKYGITNMRLFEPNLEVLNALLGTGIKVILGVRNQDIPFLAESPENANQWFMQYAEPYLSILSFIAVGNECVPNQFTTTIVKAMENIQNILNNRPGTHIGVSTVVNPGNVLGTSFPPSAAAFADAGLDEMTRILHFLSFYGHPLMINVYPFFAYADNPKDIPLDYALFTATDPVVRDGPYNYLNLFDAMVDTFYVAMERAAGVTNIAVLVAESGWPSAGRGEFTNPELAGAYNRNLVNHVRTVPGTPRHPERPVDTIIFAMFNENLKPVGEEQNFGLFFPNMDPVYPVFPIVAPRPRPHKSNHSSGVRA